MNYIHRLVGAIVLSHFSRNMWKKSILHLRAMQFFLDICGWRPFGFLQQQNIPTIKLFSQSPRIEDSFLSNDWLRVEKHINTTGVISLIRGDLVRYLKWTFYSTSVCSMNRSFTKMQSCSFTIIEGFEEQHTEQGDDAQETAALLSKTRVKGRQNKICAISF